MPVNTRDIVILNASQFNADMQRVDDALRDKIAGKGISRALTPVLRAAKKNITPRKRSGLYRKSVIRKVKRYRSGIAVGLVGPDTSVVGQFEGSRIRPQKYAHLVEYGTRPHRLGRGAVLARDDKPKLKQVQHGYKHPGAKAFGPLSRAAAETKAQAVAIYGQTVADELAKLATKEAA